MKRTLTRIIPVCTLALTLGLVGPAFAQDVEEKSSGDAAAEATAEKKAEVEEKSPWRGTSFSYSNAMSMLETDDVNFVYGMNFSFNPRYYLRDDLSIRAGFSMYVELTDGRGVDHPQQLFIGDLSFDLNYAPKWLTVPVLGIKVNPYLRLYLPTGTTARRRTLIMGLAPGLNFSRSFKLMGGDWLQNLGISYGFRAVKYFNEYKTASFKDPEAICVGGDATRPSCQGTGSRNTSWSFSNTLSINLQLHKQVSFSIMAGLINQLLYDLDEFELAKLKGITNPEAFGDTTIEETDINHRAVVSGDVGFTYSPLAWLNITAGFSAQAPQLQPASDAYYPWLFNRYAQFHFDINIPIEPLVSSIVELAK